MTKQFEAGKSYATRSIVDSDTWMRISVFSRTAKTIKTNRGTHRVSIYQGVEQVKPWGNYSMCPIIGADDEGRGEMPATARPGDMAAKVAKDEKIPYARALVLCNMD